MILPSELPGLAELLALFPNAAELDLGVEGTPAGPILRDARRRPPPAPGNLETDQSDPQEGTQ